MSVKFDLWTFHELSKLQEYFDFIDFWLPKLSRFFLNGFRKMAVTDKSACHGEVITLLVDFG